MSFFYLPTSRGGRVLGGWRGLYLPTRRGGGVPTSGRVLVGVLVGVLDTAVLLLVRS